MLPAIAAQAHNSIESTDPANGSVVGTVPAEIGLTFDHTPLAIGSLVRVVDATGVDRADGPVAIVANRVRQAVKAGAPGGQLHGDLTDCLRRWPRHRRHLYLHRRHRQSHSTPASCPGR
ncbi:copper resistance protein CopC [Pseudarthrobacter sp. Fe7]|nr:copper resistance protein CopC [Pseudarthrobacter sp. Fe7]